MLFVFHWIGWILWSAQVKSLWLLVLLYGISKLALALFRRHQVRSTFPALVKQRLAECEKSFAYDVREDELSEDLRKQIIDSDVLALRELIWSGKVSSEQVLRFYFSRAKTVGRKLGAAIEANFEEALRLAKQADQLIQSKPRSELPLLCGIPFSVKEIFPQKGFETTLGMEKRIGRKKFDRNSPIVDHLIAQGAIPFVRSNMPQIFVPLETNNPIFGRCVNPHNHKRVPGGSSGGEGSLVASGCSPFGIGSDIGGSIRIPSLLCGVFGFKPSNDRMAAEESLDPIHCDYKTDLYQTIITVCNGPLAKSVDDLRVVTEVLNQQDMISRIDPTRPTVPWRTEAVALGAREKLTIGYIESLDGIFEAAAPNKRAVSMVVEALRKEGHILKPVVAPELSEVYDIAFQIFMSDPSFPDNIAISNGIESIAPNKLLHLFMFAPNWLKKTLAFFLHIANIPRLASSLASTVLLNEKQIFQMIIKKKDMTKAFLKRLTDDNITHIISPGLGTPAPLHDTTGDLLQFAAYAVLFNFLGLPTGALPVTTVRADEQTYTSAFNDPITVAAQKCLEGSEGLPVGVQVSAFPFRDEECLALMSEIERIMKLKPFLKL